MEPWLKKYLKYTAKHEAPEMFHLWTGLTILSAVLGRKIFFDRGYYTLYPNLFTVLVAGSARCRKSTAIGIGVDLLKSMDTAVKILSGKTSPERFLGDMQHEGPSSEDVPPTIIHADELSVFLTRDSQGDRLIDLLTKLFDCPKKFEYKTWSHGTIGLRDVFVTILAGTTPEGTAKCMPDTAFGGGFTSRIMFIYQGDTKRRNALPELTLEEVEMKEELVAGLINIGRIRGEFKLTDDGRAFYSNWYDKMEFGEDKRMEGYFGRKHDHALRIGMLLSASMGHHPWIDDSHLDAAIAALDDMEYWMPLAFAHVGTKDIRVHIERISRQMEKLKRVPHSELLKRNYHYLNAKEFRDVMTTLITSGVVTRDKEKMHFYVWVGPQGVPEDEA